MHLYLSPLPHPTELDLPAETEIWAFQHFEDGIAPDLFRPNNLLLLGDHKITDMLRITQIDGPNLVLSSVCSPRLVNNLIVPVSVVAHQIRPVVVIKTPPLITGVHRPAANTVYLTAEGRLVSWATSRWVAPPRLLWRGVNGSGGLLRPFTPVSYSGMATTAVAPPLLRATAVTQEEIRTTLGLTFE